jgi:hypothetical protein
MPRVWLFGSLRGGSHADEQVGVLNLEFVTRDGVVFIAWLALTVQTMKLPIVPRANHVVTLQATLTQRPSGVVANI